MTTAELKNIKSKIENIKFQYATAKTGKTSNSPSGQGYQKAYNTINSVKKKKIISIITQAHGNQEVKVRKCM